MPPTAISPLNLPQPDEASRAHSARVAEHIRSRMAAAGGSLSFAEFMQEALYAPGLGYYSAGATRFGAAGDFVTAPETSPLFGRVLARQCAFVLQQLAEPRILELGAGSGVLAIEILRNLPRHGIEGARYSILEVSPDLRERQQDRIAARVPELADRIEWLDRLPDGFSGVVLANEVADALPVERFERTPEGVLQHRVAAQEDGFAWRREPAPGFLEQAVLQIEEYPGVALPAGYVSEVSTGLAPWVGDIARSLAEGMVFLFDYGMTRREYYAAGRNGGWLRCHFRHRAHDDPLIYPGIQDLSAWVDFTAVAEGAADAGLSISGFVTQAAFLLGGGLEAEVAALDQLQTTARLELARQVKLLTLPGEMGEYFKCIGLARGTVETPAAFLTADRAHAL